MDQEYSCLYDNDVWECIELYLNLPDTPHPGEHPLNYAHICGLQQQDEQLLALQVKYPDNFINLQLDDNVDDIICYKVDVTDPKYSSGYSTQWQGPRGVMIHPTQWQGPRGANLIPL